MVYVWLADDKVYDISSFKCGMPQSGHCDVMHIRVQTGWGRCIEGIWYIYHGDEGI